MVLDASGRGDLCGPRRDAALRAGCGELESGGLHIAPFFPSKVNK